MVREGRRREEGERERGGVWRERGGGEEGREEDTERGTGRGGGREGERERVREGEGERRERRGRGREGGGEERREKEEERERREGERGEGEREIERVSQKYAPRSNGSARSAVLETGGVVRIAHTVQVSRTMLRCSADLSTGEHCCSGEDASWYGRRRAYFGWQEGFGERTRKTPKEAQWTEKKRQSTSRPNKIGSTENPNASSPRVQSWRRCKRTSEYEKKL